MLVARGGDHPFQGDHDVHFFFLDDRQRLEIDDGFLSGGFLAQEFVEKIVHVGGESRQDFVLVLAEGEKAANLVDNALFRLGEDLTQHSAKRLDRLFLQLFDDFRHARGPRE